MSHSLKAGLSRFSCSKCYKHGVACGKDTDCWQVPFLKMAILMVKEDMISGCKLIFFHLVDIICT